MTYCLGIVLPAGLVLASDSRSNAGIDQVTRVRKFELFTQPGNRVITILSAGNLATTQSVTSQIREMLNTGYPGTFSPPTACSRWHASVGDKLREVIAARRPIRASPMAIPPAASWSAARSWARRPRLFQIYSAGNFIEASLRSCFLQIGETKYGKPILDRALTPDCPLDQAAKLALLSFDATLRSNLSCGMPIDILRYETDSFSANNLAMLKDDDPYWTSLRNAYGEGLSGLVKMLPPPPSWGV